MQLAKNAMWMLGLLVSGLTPRMATAQTKPDLRAVYRLQAPAFGGTTMGALGTWRRVAAQARRDTLTAEQVAVCQQILARATTGKHFQQKLRGRYCPFEIQVHNERFAVLVEQDLASYVVVYDRPGKTMAPGHYYSIQAPQDRQMLLRLSRPQ